MSFANYDLEGQKHTAEDKITGLSNSITNFAAGLASLEKLSQQIGTKRDNTSLRKRIEKNLQFSETELEKIKGSVHSMQLSGVDETRSELIVTKLHKELNSLSATFQKLKTEYREKTSYVTLNERMSANDVALAADTGVASETVPLLQQQSQQHQQQLESQEPQINKYESDFHTLLVEQRERSINEIHQGVQDINTIFKDLNSLVLEQGGKIDTIENNLNSLANDTQNATQELHKANVYQQKKRRYCCVLLVVLVVFTLIVSLAVLS